MAEGPDGTVAAGTTEGLSVFDGEGWTSHTVSDGLASEEVGSVAVGPDGGLAAVTGEGLSVFDGQVLDDPHGRRRAARDA